MTQLKALSQQALLQEIKTWEQVIGREVKKLKRLRGECKGKLKQNSIDIVTIEMESELLKYRKTKDKVFADAESIVDQYTILSKRMMQLMEKAGEAADEEPGDTTEIVQHAPRRKSFLNSTFTSKGKSKATKAKKSAQENLRKLESEEEHDLWDIRYQLKQIKSMMKQMQQEIKTHSHQDMEKQLNLLEQNSKRMGLDVKRLKEDNQLALARLQNAKDELQEERKVQSDLIRRIDQTREQSKSFYNKSINPDQDVSDWVKIRI